MRTIAVLTFPGVVAFDLASPCHVFGLARYDVRVCGEGPVRAGAFDVAPPHGLEAAAAADTIIVPGVEDLWVPSAVVEVLRAARGRVVSICTGAFALAQAGLLDGRRATTHWRFCDALAERHPLVEVDPDPVFVRDGDIWTSAGVTAGMDLALALVEDDLGAEVALAVARMLVVFFKRPGGQSQFSGALAVQQASRPALRELQAWIAGHLDEDLAVAALADRAGLSERSFARAFRAEVGQTPAVYVEGLRVERARALLEDGAQSLEAVARAAGFSSPEVLRRAFHRRVGVSPAAYRERFRLAA